MYQFATPAQQTQFVNLTQQLRCLVCQNETLADSNAPLAKDLRDEIASMIKQHQSDTQIRAYLTTRYGNFILYKPVFAPSTYLLWLGPVLLFLIGIIILAFFILRRKKP